jgi:hypothetical protein
MPAEGQALHGSQRGESFKHAGFVFVARARVPDFARQIKLPQMREAFEFAELDGAHYGGGKVDGDNMEVAGRQLKDIADGLASGSILRCPFQNQTAFPAEHPLRDLAFGSCRRGDREKEEGRNELAHLFLFYSHECYSTGTEPPLAGSATTQYERERSWYRFLPVAARYVIELCRIAFRWRVFVLDRMILLFLAGGALWGQSGEFRTTLFPILEKANCRACHNADGVASATRLHFPEADADADKIAAFGNSLVVLVDRQNPDASLLLRKPTSRIPHTGGERIKQNSPEEAVLKAWIAKLTQLSGAELITAL